MRTVLRNFVKNLSRFRVASALNLLGLTAAFTVFMVIVSQLNWEYHFNGHIKDHERIYALAVDGVFDEQTFGLSRPIGEYIVGRTPEVEEYVSIFNWNQVRATKLTENEKFTIHYQLMSPSGIEMFNFKMLEGKPIDTLSLDQAMIPASLAATHFGNDALGESIKLEYYGMEKTYTIAGVYEDFPSNSHISNSMYVPMGEYMMDNPSNWATNYYLKIREGVDAKNLATNFREIIISYYLEQYSGMTREQVESEVGNLGILVYPLSTMYFDIAHLKNNYAPQRGNPTISYMLLVIALLVVFVAVVNYINFYMVSVPTHIKMVNIRRIFGANVHTLRLFIILEAMMMMMIALALSYVVVSLLGHTFVADSLDIKLGLGENLEVLFATLIFALSVGFLASLLPVFYTTQFPLMLTIKGAFASTRQGHTLRTVLTSFQFIISMIFITFSVFVLVQNSHMKNFDYGFERDRIITIDCDYSVASNPQSLYTELLNHPAIEAAAFGDGQLYNTGMSWGRTINGESITIISYPTSYGLPKLLGVALIEGRSFTEDDAKKIGGTAIINETAARLYHMKVGDKFRGHSDEEDAEVVGIVKDFNFGSLKNAVKPMCFYEFGTDGWRTPSTLFVRVAPGYELMEVVEFLRSKSSLINPNIVSPDELFIESMNEGAMQLYQKEDQLSRVVTLFAIIATLITFMGVLGIVIIEANYRKREIALRKVYGATPRTLLIQFNSKFIVPLTISALFAVPVAWFLTDAWLSEFAFRTEMYGWIFVVGVGAVALITFITITLQTLSVVRENPIQSITTNN